MIAFSTLVDHLRARRSGSEYIARCPAHNDTKPSLTLSQNGDRILMHCFAGCEFNSIVGALGYQQSDFYEDRKRSKSEKNDWGEIVELYDYDHSIVHARTSKKKFPWGRRTPTGIKWGLNGTRPGLYHADQLKQLEPGATVVWVEGEKDVHNVESKLDLIATTAGGSGDWSSEFAGHLRDFDLLICRDNDVPGHSHAEEVAHDCYGKAKSVRVLPDFYPDEAGSDVTNWIERGGTQKDFLDIALNTPEWVPATLEAEERERVSSTVKEKSPPPIAKAAYHGVAGEIVSLIEPHTEAAPEGLLAQVLIAFGNSIGRNAHIRVEATDHYMNEFAVMVGATSKSRKGTSGNRVLHVFDQADSYWREECVEHGLSSGEGLISEVRDGTFKPNGDVIDAGVSDKRRLIYEAEFARVLKVASREGNTLSTQLRLAWDDGKMRVMTKTNPLRATDAHLSIIGHITKEEIVRLLNSTEASNGFANRFLWIWVRRSKCLPFGGGEVTFNQVVTRLQAALKFARDIGRITWGDDAAPLWEKVYPQLSEGMPGLLGAVTSRAEAHTMRLACLYALLDCSNVIRLAHLEAALAFWRYAEDSARFIFGDAMGDPLADEVLRLLRESSPDGLTRTDLYNLFGRNRKGSEISASLSLLAEHGLAYNQIEPTEGRKAERWFANTY